MATEESGREGEKQNRTGGVGMVTNRACAMPCVVLDAVWDGSLAGLLVDFRLVRC